MSRNVDTDSSVLPALGEYLAEQGILVYLVRTEYLSLRRGNLFESLGKIIYSIGSDTVIWDMADPRCLDQIVDYLRIHEPEQLTTSLLLPQAHRNQ